VSKSTVKSALSVVKQVAAPLELSAPRGSRRPKGRPLLPTMLLGPRFRRSVSRSLEGVRTDLLAIGITSEEQLRKVLVEAHQLLGKANVTATDWVGRVFEVLGADLPEVRLLENSAVDELLGLVNRFIARNTGVHFTNGYGLPVGVSKDFGDTQVIRNVRIRRPNWPKGFDYVDRGHLARNSDHQQLFVSGEFKTRGVADKLRSQVTNRDPRMVEGDHPPGTKLIYEVEGRQGEFAVELSDVILVTGSKSPALLREAGVFSRIGVRAGSRFSAKIAYDDRGEPYVRIVVWVATDPIRRLLEKLLRDRSWQS
jgi:hypothetical protein